ncbi:hypothetical protein FRC12_010527 [Ceratobasidium sp. 428]|nr:hypothetical protein FRC12_010527 [Ceratobasidium sp. 428]
MAEDIEHQFNSARWGEGSRDNPYWRTHPEAIFLLQPPIFVHPPPLDDKDLCDRGAHSTHDFDGFTNRLNADALGLLRGEYSSILGALWIISYAYRRYWRTVRHGLEEILRARRSGKYIGDYASQARALNRSLNGANGKNVMNWTL